MFLFLRNGEAISEIFGMVVPANVHFERGRAKTLFAPKVKELYIALHKLYHSIVIAITFQNVHTILLLCACFEKKLRTLISNGTLFPVL